MGKFGLNPNYGTPAPQQPRPAIVPPQQMVTTMPVADPNMGMGIGGGKGYTPTSRDFNNPFQTRWTAAGTPQDAAGRPLNPEFISMGDPKTGLLRSEYNLTNTADQGGMNALRSEALRPAGQMSKWGQMALSQAQNQNAAQNAGAQSTARNQLAMSGGLRSGARERLAAQGMQGQLKGNQNALLNTQIQDEATRQKWLGQLPGMEIQNAQYGAGIQDKNINRAMGEVNIGRGIQQNQYDKAMQAWAADKSAAAAAGAKKDGGFNIFDPLNLVPMGSGLFG
jgi:hypothetical protein